jgi:hypothetical protein
MPQLLSQHHKQTKQLSAKACNIMTLKFTKLFIISIIVGTFSVLLGGASVEAQASGGEYLQKCMVIENNQERLACFDEAAKSNKPTTQTKVKIPAKIKPIAETFGLPERKTKKEEEASSLIQVVVSSWKRNQLNKTTFVTTSGQVWHQTDSVRLRLKKKDYKATIKKGLIGGYILRLDGINRSIRVKRIK